MAKSTLADRADQTMWRPADREDRPAGSRFQWILRSERRHHQSRAERPAATTPARDRRGVCANPDQNTLPCRFRLRGVALAASRLSRAGCWSWTRPRRRGADAQPNVYAVAQKPTQRDRARCSTRSTLPVGRARPGSTEQIREEVIRSSMPPTRMNDLGKTGASAFPMSARSHRHDGWARAQRGIGSRNPARRGDMLVDSWYDTYLARASYRAGRIIDGEMKKGRRIRPECGTQDARLHGRTHRRDRRPSW